MSEWKWCNNHVINFIYLKIKIYILWRDKWGERGGGSERGVAMQYFDTFLRAYQNPILILCCMSGCERKEPKGKNTPSWAR